VVVPRAPWSRMVSYSTVISGADMVTSTESALLLIEISSALIVTFRPSSIALARKRDDLLVLLHDRSFLDPPTLSGQQGACAVAGSHTRDARLRGRGYPGGRPEPVR
jgi:hypothetical protein